MHANQPYPSANPYPLTHPKFIRYLMAIGLSLVAVSLLYLVGANWFMMPNAIKLALPMILMVLFALLSLMVSPKDDTTKISTVKLLKNTFETISGAMIGLSLAVIGQVYQSGADSFWLFMIWTVLLLPWCYRQNIGIFVLMAVVSQVAFWLMLTSQNMDFGVLITALALLTLAQFFVASWWYRSLLWLFVLECAVIASIGAVSINFHQSISYINFTGFLALVIMWWYAKRCANAWISSLSLIGFGTALFVGLCVHVFTDKLFAIGFMAMLWFGAMGYLILCLFPNANYHAIAFGIGGWFSAWFISLFMLFDIDNLPLITGLLFIIVGIAILKQYYHHTYLRHLGYALFAMGQVASYIGVDKYFGLNNFWIQLPLQTVLLGVLIYLRVHWLYLALQMLAWYGMISYDIMQIFDDTPISQALLMVVGTLPMVALYQRRIEYLKKPLAITMIGVLAVLAAVSSFDEIGLLNFHANMDYVVLPILLIVFYQLYQLDTSKHHLTTIALFLGLTIMLMVLGYINIGVMLLILAYGIYQKDKAITVLSVFLLMFLLWQLYYSLAIPFLLKFITLLLSGMMMFILALIINKKGDCHVA
ncbi:DUF2157 domain-containing protein [Moraxella nasovis]|uniref:DUF2157 domain-containing protein n=1 Tax=Moraxella nasovis TaxID=2904121 RepID=UPI001F60478B|nr:DUF2157 domain-containing protein [Moraxella nasovis]UNU74067.1 DUF2157 domain-containing protein [Moraxella nasovis]